MKNKRKQSPQTNLHKVKHVTIETASDEDRDSSTNSESSSGEDDVPAPALEAVGVNNDSEGGRSSNDADEDSINSQAETDENIMKNEGWADSVAKILGTNKPKNKKTLVLSRAKKFTEVVKKEEPSTFDVVGDEKPNVSKIKIEAELVKKRKIEHPSARVKPNILEKDRERVLSKIATKGVVQLFNAVKNQQTALGNEMNTAGLSEGKKEKILKKFDKRTFLDTLMGQTKSTIVEDSTEPLKDEVKDEDKPKWVALRDDFMMGAKMKDWDKTLDD